MKTLEQFIKEIETSEELREELKTIKDAFAADAFLKKHNCGAAAEELADFIRSQMKNDEGELSDDEASAAAGGIWFDIGFGRFWVDETLPERKSEKVLPDHVIQILEEDD